MGNNPDVVFNINPLGMAGLGATLVSLIQHSSQELDLHFLCCGLSTANRLDINRILNDNGHVGDIEFYDYDAKALFGSLKSLHGDYTTYGKSLVPSLIPSKVVLYLDSDLIVNTDVSSIFKASTNDHPISATTYSTASTSFDSHFLTDNLGLSRDMPYFNAGVMLFNRAAYSEEKMDERWRAVTKKYPRFFFSADQTVFNAVCEGKFGRLENRYNQPWLPGGTNSEAEYNNTIIHFVGSPKPWDFMGHRLHKGYGVWKKYTPAFWHRNYCQFSFRTLRRTWKIRRSLARHILGDRSKFSWWKM